MTEPTPKVRLRTAAAERQYEGRNAWARYYSHAMVQMSAPGRSATPTHRATAPSARLGIAVGLSIALVVAVLLFVLAVAR